MHCDYPRTKRSRSHDSLHALAQYATQLSALTLLTLLLLLGACSPTSAPERLDGIAMTMPYCIKIGDQSPDMQQVEQIVVSTFMEVNSIYNNWNPQSEISRINQLPRHIHARLSPKLAAFLKRVDALVKLTEGRFDPTVAPVKEELLKGNLTDKLDYVGWQKIHLDGGSIWKEHDKSSIDLGGVAKGYGVDLLVENLQEAGFRQLYVEWGGEIRVTGEHPERRPWRVAIQGGDTLELKEEAIATSGSYLQEWTIEAVSYTHIIDPATQKPLADSPITSASVVAPTCLEADALATALMLFSSTEEATTWAEERGLKIWLF